MPDTSPSLSMLQRLGLGNSMSPQQQVQMDSQARQQQSGLPLWKRLAGQGVDALANIPKGLLGIDPNSDDSTGGYLANVLTQFGGAAKPLMTAGMVPLNFEQKLMEMEQGLPKFSISNAYGPNASGESSASLEAINRMKSMKNKSQQFTVIDRSGNKRPLIGPDAVDYRVKPGERYGIDSPSGFQLLDK